MIYRPGMAWLTLLAVTGSSWAQAPATGPAPGPAAWRPPAPVAQAAAQTETAQGAAPQNGAAARPPIARVTKGTGTLPNDHGQVWREYDISPYTARVTNSDRPEQAIIDWILRETGYEAWHSDPLGVLSADRQTLRVYHTPEVQQIVSEIVDRFVDPRAESHVFGLGVMSIGNPNWRSKAMHLMRPIPVQSQGIQGWLLAKEDAALLINELRNRTDFRELSSPQMAVNNGQHTVLSRLRPRMYVRGVLRSGGVWPGFNPDVAQLEEGYTLQFSPLLSLDGSTIDAVVKLQLNQVEKMVPVMLDMPSGAAQRQRTRVEVPQMTMCTIHERFRWPADEVLLLSMGVVASPDGTGGGNAITNAFSLSTAPPRVDALLMIQSKGRIASGTHGQVPAARRPMSNFSGRY